MYNLKAAVYILSTILILVTACNNDNEEKKEPPSDSRTNQSSTATTPATTNHTIDKLLEDRITDTLMTIPFVKKTNQYLDSLTRHKKGIAFTIDPVADNEIFVMAGYNGPDRFETYYRFTIYPKTFDIMIEYPESGELISIDQYIKLKKP